jgi:hypothetical protein
MSAQNRKRALRGGVTLAIVLQFLVPAIALTRTPPTRFGFQMYSGVGSLPVLTTVDASGREQRVPLDSIAAQSRVEIDWADRAVQYLCRTRPTLVEVRVVEHGQKRTIPC